MWKSADFPSVAPAERRSDGRFRGAKAENGLILT